MTKTFVETTNERRDFLSERTCDFISSEHSTMSIESCRKRFAAKEEIQTDDQEICDESWKYKNATRKIG